MPTRVLSIIAAATVPATPPAPARGATDHASLHDPLGFLQVGPVQVLLWVATVLVVMFVAARVLHRPGASPGEVARAIVANSLRVLLFAVATFVVIAALWVAAGMRGPIGFVATIVSDLLYFATAYVAGLFLARQVLAPPWWRLNAWEPRQSITTFGIGDAIRWIRDDIADLVDSLRLIDKLVIFVAIPLAGFNVLAIVGTQRALLTMNAVMLVCYVALVVALFTANRIPRVLMSRLQELRGVARRIAGGDLSARAGYNELGEYEELGELVSDLNTMARALEMREQENAALNGQLQQTLQFEQERATRDPLTQLRNHRYFHEALASELYRCSRTGELTTVAIIDLDNFKMVNDTYGHQEGDAVLLRTAQALTQTLRPYDLAARLGGEEFGVIFPSTTPEDAKVVMDRIMEVLATAGPEGTSQTFSGGIASFPIHAREQSMLCQLADSSAYAAKMNGKAHNVVFDPSKVSNVAEDDRVNTRERDAQIKAAKTLVQTVDMIEGLGNEHSENVGRTSAAIAGAMGFDDSYCQQMYLCGLLHDVGKLGLEQSVVQKAGALTDAEYEQVKRHPILSAQIVANAGLGDIAEWVRHHHENFDGTGYPHGLAGQDIPLGSRIVLVAEAFDVMTSDRAYRRAMSIADTLGELYREAGTRFDPSVVAALVELIRTGEVRPGGGSPPASGGVAA